MELNIVAARRQHNCLGKQEPTDMRNRIGITYREPEKLTPYVAALNALGAEPIPLSPEKEASLEGLHGLLLSGGVDVNPRFYGQERLAETDEPDDERDEMELRLLRDALSRDISVLGICRGMQLFNVLHGGTLIQHIEDAQAHHHRFSSSDHRVLHPVYLDARSRLAGICGSKKFLANSRHHQAVGSLGMGLIATAWGSDGVIESIERPGSHFALAVQWHPEDRIASVCEDRNILASFIRAATPVGTRAMASWKV